MPKSRKLGAGRVSAKHSKIPIDILGEGTTKGILPVGRRKPPKQEYDFYEKEMSRKAQNFQNLMRRRGVAVERVVRRLDSERVVVQRCGKSLDMLPEETAKKALLNAAEPIAIMHSLGIKHNHLHYGNIILAEESGRTGLIDFKLASREKEIMKESPVKIALFFGNEYLMLNEWTRKFAVNPMELIRKIVERYPLTRERREQVIDIIIQIFRHWEEYKKKHDVPIPPK